MYEPEMSPIYFHRKVTFVANIWLHFIISHFPTPNHNRNSQMYTKLLTTRMCFLTLVYKKVWRIVPFRYTRHNDYFSLNMAIACSTKNVELEGLHLLLYHCFLLYSLILYNVDNVWMNVICVGDSDENKWRLEKEASLCWLFLFGTFSSCLT